MFLLLIYNMEMKMDQEFFHPSNIFTSKNKGRRGRSVLSFSTTFLFFTFPFFSLMQEQI